MKQYELPPWMNTWVDKYLKTLGYNLNRPQELAKAILAVSDNYQESASQTPWKSPQTQAAYLAYFFPLNYIRSLKLIDEASSWGLFDKALKGVDFGCGPGTLSKALLETQKGSIKNLMGVDHFSELGKYYLDSPRKDTDLSFLSDIEKTSQNRDLLLAGYVLNELPELPPWLFEFKNIIVMEPSTKQFFPKLLDLRNSLIAKGYSILGPCPHHESCPLQESKKDWCHDRVHWSKPDWFQKIENHLPIKNNTLTFSYLIASKEISSTQDYSRVVGDKLTEKGKTRWMICRNSEREFLSHLKRQGPAPDHQRGDKLKLENFEKKGNELRLNQN